MSDLRNGAEYQQQFLSMVRWDGAEFDDPIVDIDRTVQHVFTVSANVTGTPMAAAFKISDGTPLAAQPGALTRLGSSFLWTGTIGANQLFAATQHLLRIVAGSAVCEIELRTP